MVWRWSDPLIQNRWIDEGFFNSPKSLGLSKIMITMFPRLIGRQTAAWPPARALSARKGR